MEVRSRSQLGSESGGRATTRGKKGEGCGGTQRPGIGACATNVIHRVKGVLVHRARNAPKRQAADEQVTFAVRDDGLRYAVGLRPY